MKSVIKPRPYVYWSYDIHPFGCEERGKAPEHPRPFDELSLLFPIVLLFQLEAGKYLVNESVLAATHR